MLETLEQLQTQVRTGVDCPRCGALPGAFCAGRSLPGRRAANHPERARAWREVNPRIEEGAGSYRCQVCRRPSSDAVCAACGPVTRVYS